MFYKYEQGTQLSLTSTQTVRYFNDFPDQDLTNICFIDDGQVENKSTGLSLYVPTKEQLTLLGQDYADWCEKFSQKPNTALQDHFTDAFSVFGDDMLAVLEARAAAFEENLNKDMYFMSSLGFKCNGDRRTRSNIQDLITGLSTQEDDATVDYRDYDNQIQKLNKSQLETLYSEHLQNGLSLYRAKWSKQDQIAAATSLDDLHEISLDFEMMDFTVSEDEE